MTEAYEKKWDECPKCGETLDLLDHFPDKDYQDEFDYECHKCGASLSVTVHLVAEFKVEVEKQ